MRTWPVQDAKARFSEFLDACMQEGPQMLLCSLLWTNGAGSNRLRAPRSSNFCCLMTHGQTLGCLHVAGPHAALCSL